MTIKRFLTQVLRHDRAAYDALPEGMRERGYEPERLLADTAYGSEDNVQACTADGIELISPVNRSKLAPDTLNVGDFTIDPETEQVQRCPAGHPPRASVYDAKKEQTTTRMDAAARAIYLKVTGWNIRRAAAEKMRHHIAETMGQQHPHRAAHLIHAALCVILDLFTSHRHPHKTRIRLLQPKPKNKLVTLLATATTFGSRVLEGGGAKRRGMLRLFTRWLLELCQD